MKNITAPRNLKIKGQDHMLAYITAKEAEALKARGGSGRMTKYGIRSYEDSDGPGGDSSDNSNSNSEANTQDAADGNTGQGAGPTGAGAGAGPGVSDPGPVGENQSEVSAVGMAPGISTAPTAVGPIGPEDEAAAAAARGAIANAPVGFESFGLMDAIDAYNQGKMGLADVIGVGLTSALGPPGFGFGYAVDPMTQTQTPAVNISGLGVGLGALGAISGVPGLGALGGLAGTALGNAMGLGTTTVGYSPGEYGGAPSPESGGNGLYDGGLLAQVPPVELPSAVGVLPERPRYQIVNNTLVPVPSGLLG